jgi:hypothetical protein
MFGVQNAVQNGIENLSGSSVNVNGQPGDEYRFRARTKEELLASQQLAAGKGSVHAGKRVLDPAVTELNAQPWEDEDQTKIVVTDRVPPPKAPPKTWIL